MSQNTRDFTVWMTFRWALMLGAIFWTVVYKLSESGIKVPDFVYVNF